MNEKKELLTDDGASHDDELLAEVIEQEEAFTKESEHVTGIDHEGQRLDVYVARLYPELTRNFVQKLVEKGHILVDGQSVKAACKLKPGQTVQITIPEPEPVTILPEDIPLDVVYEDHDVIVVNKPQGMVVHPATGNYSGTLVNALLYHCQDLSGINGVMRPGIVHRIDKDTSGLLMVAKNDLAHAKLAEQIKERQVTRKYLALVHGNLPEPKGIIDAPIGRDAKDRQKMAVVHQNSKPARTHYTVLQRYGEYTLVECKLETGRTHQIRVHMAYLGHPVVGDPKYGPRKPHLTQKGQFLHAAVLGFAHPRTGEYLELQRELPEDMQQILDALAGNAEA